MKTLLITLITLGAALAVQAQGVTRQVTVTVTVTNAADVAMIVAAAKLHNIEHGTSLTPVQWVEAELNARASDYIVSKAEDDLLAVRQDAMTWLPELTDAEQSALFARRKAVLDALAEEAEE